MKPTSERMMKTGTEQRIRTPAIWTILKDYATEVEELEEQHAAMKEWIGSSMHMMSKHDREEWFTEWFDQLKDADMDEELSEIAAGYPHEDH